MPESRYKAGGIEVTCFHCKNNQFKKGAAQLNTKGMSFLNLDWLNKSATVLTCTRCSLILWFQEEPQEID